MNLLGTWFKRNGVFGLNIAFNWSLRRDGLSDSITINHPTSPLLFTYTPAGLAPVDAYNEPLLSTNLSFSYTPAGMVPVDATEDPLALSASITDFSYTL